MGDGMKPFPEVERDTLGFTNVEGAIKILEWWVSELPTAEKFAKNFSKSP